MKKKTKMKQKTKFKKTEIGLIPEDWEVRKLGDVAEVVGGGTPSTKNKEYWNGKFSWLTPKDLSNYNSVYISKGERSISEKGLKNSSAKLIPKGSVLLTSRAPVGYLAIAKNELTTNQGFRSLIPINKETISEFLYYLLKSKIAYLKSQAYGSTFGEISGTSVKNLEFAFPSLPEQFAIAHILSTLDEKIELLQRQNKTLEEIGQAIFKKWFTEEGGEKIKNIQDILVFEKGVEPGSKCYEAIKTEKNVKFIRVGDINSPGKANTYIPLNLVNDKLCDERDILLSLDATLGIVRIGMKGAHSGGVRKVYSKDGKFSKGLIYFLLKSDYVQETIRTYAHGTTILHAGNSLNYMEIIIPKVEKLLKLNISLEIIFNKLIINLKQIQTLSQVRDSLLPKLMSGKIRVPIK